MQICEHGQLGPLKNFAEWRAHAKNSPQKTIQLITVTMLLIRRDKIPMRLATQKNKPKMKYHLMFWTEFAFTLHYPMNLEFPSGILSWNKAFLVLLLCLSAMNSGKIQLSSGVGEEHGHGRLRHREGRAKPSVRVGPVKTAEAEEQPIHGSTR